MSTLKSIVKKLVRPFTRRLFLRMDARVAPVQEHVTNLQSDVDELKRYLPTLLDVISSHSGAAREWKRAELRLNEKIDQLEQRGEFIRRELMFEVRYGGHAKGAGGQAEPEILDREKVDSARNRLRLNLGCGHIPLDGYINVDGRKLPGVDIRANVDQLPFEAGEVSEIYSAHLLEHFPVEELSRALLPYWHSLLEPGGRFVAVVPDANTMITEYAAGRFTFQDLRQVTFGLQEYEGDFHFNMFTPQSLSELLEAAGFVNVHVEETGRRNGACYEMQLAAEKAAAEAQAAVASERQIASEAQATSDP
jgi:predicted SAM-dependent methyltransferase